MLAALALLLTTTLVRAELIHETQREGFTPAPIHGEEVEFKIDWKTPYQKDRVTPEVISREAHFVWEGQARTPKGHPFPALYLRTQIAIQAGAVLSTASDKPAAPEHLPADDRDVFTFDLPVRKMSGNSTPFFVRLAGGQVAEFDLVFTLHLKEAITGLHKSCVDEGVKLTEQTGGTHPLFLYVRCVREDRVLYLNILKPLDRNFVASHTSKQLLETPGQPVVRVALLPEQVRRATTLAQARIVDPATGGLEQYLLTFESKGPEGLRLALGLGPTFVSHNESGPRAGPRSKQLPVSGLLETGYVFFPGAWELNASFRGTLVPLMLSGDPEAARWYDVDYHLGWLIRVGPQEHVLGVHVGVTHFVQQVQSNDYGLGRHGSSALIGPQLMLNMNYRPYGRLGWGAYVKFSLMGENFSSLGATRFDRAKTSLGASFDLPWFAGLARRPAVLIDSTFVSFQLGATKMNETQVMLGLMVPIL